MIKRPTIRLRSPIICFVFLVAALFSYNVVKNTTFTYATDSGAFNPGNIISDYVMSNYNSMTESEVQAFLSGRGNCNNSDWSLYKSLISKYPNTTWHWKDGHFVCLAEERFGEGIEYGENLNGGGETAAHIIWQTAQDYKINPQVLIVLLQKEQGLITDSYPNSVQYRSATGYGCPDTAACNEKYYGFKNQIRNAAGLFRTVLDGGWTNYPLGENYIKYNPDASCGGSTVNIENLATSALYRYTPYQPNAATLAAGYGTAPCGAYGNRNFYLFFNDYFGDTTSTEPNSIKLDNGNYNIVSTINGQYQATSLDAQNLVNANIAKDWYISMQEDGYYTIKDTATGLFMTANGNQVYLNKADNGDGQKWIIVKNIDNTVTIYSKLNLLVVDVDGAANKAKTKIKLYKQWGDNNLAQKWLLTKVQQSEENDDYGLVYSGDDGMTITSIENKIIVARYNFPDLKQHWEIKKIENTHYSTITNIDSNLTITVENDKFANKTKIIQSQNNNTCSQKWIINIEENPTKIRNACYPNFVLDLDNGKTDMQIYRETDYDNVHQKWVLKKNSTNISGNVLLANENGKIVHADGQNNIIADKTTGEIVQWKIQKNGEYYEITNHNNLLLTVDGEIQNKTNVIGKIYDGTCKQRWIIGRENNAFIIKSACDTNYVLDLHNGDQNVQIYEKTTYDNAHQKWKINWQNEIEKTGVYTIKYSGDSNKVITTVGLNDMVNIQTNAYRVGDTLEQWVFEKSNNGYYKIINANTGKVLDVKNGSFTNKTNVWQYTINDTCAQQWNLMQSYNGAYIIENNCYSNYVLDLQSGISNVQIYERTSCQNPHQEWLLEKAETPDYSGEYIITNINGGSKTLSYDGANVEAQTKDETTKQQWIIQKNNKYYTIKNKSSGKLLSINNKNGYQNKTNVELRDYDGNCGQRWEILEKKQNSVIIIRSVCDVNYVLDLQNGDKNVQIYTETAYDNPHQEWVLKKI